MADTDRRTVKANRRDQMFARCAVGADKCFAKIGAVAGKPTGNRDRFADRAGDPGNQLTAIDVQAIRQNENADQVGCRQGAADRVAAGAGTFGRARRFASDAEAGRIEADCRGGDLVVVDVVVVDLPAGAAAENVSGRKHRAQFAITSAARKRLPRTEKENQVSVGAIAGNSGPTGVLAPTQLSHAHGGH